MSSERGAPVCTVAFYPGLRKIHVERGRIAAPSAPDYHTPERVMYRTSFVDTILSTVICLFAFVLLSLQVGSLAVPIFVVLMVVLQHIGRKKARLAQEQMMRELPRQTVAEIVKRSFAECSRSEAEEIRIDTQVGTVSVVCGYMGECVEYSRQRVAAFTGFIGAAAVALAVSYALFVYAVPYVLLLMLVILAATRKKSLCVRRALKKVV